MNNHMQLYLESSSTKMNLNSHEEGIYLVPDLDGLTSLPTIRSSQGVNAGMDGGWTSAQFFDARLISVKLVIANEDISVVESKRRALNNLLAQGRREELTLSITTEAGNAFSVGVRVTNVQSVLSTSLRRQDFLIQFRADDPIIYGYSEEGGMAAILRVSQALGGFTINFEMPLLIGGGAEAVDVENGEEYVFPIIKLTGPLHTPVIVNRTTDQQMLINADLTSTDVMIIDSQLKTVTLNGADVYYLLDEGSDFIEIAPGINKMSLQSAQPSDEGIAEVRFKQGYLSI